MGDVPRCPAKSKRSGKQCRNAPFHRPDGSRTVHCKFHGGKNEAAPPGDPIRGGRPPTHGLHAKYLPQEFRDELADGIGSIDEEISVTRVFYVRAVKEYLDNPRGGIPIAVEQKNGAPSVRIRPWAEVVDLLSDKLRKLRLARVAIAQQSPPDDDDFDSYDAWLRVNASSRPPPSSRGSS